MDYEEEHRQGKAGVGPAGRGHVAHAGIAPGGPPGHRTYRRSGQGPGCRTPEWREADLGRLSAGAEGILVVPIEKMIL